MATLKQLKHKQEELDGLNKAIIGHAQKLLKISKITSYNAVEEKIENIKPIIEYLGNIVWRLEKIKKIK